MPPERRVAARRFQSKPTTVPIMIVIHVFTEFSRPHNKEHD